MSLTDKELTAKATTWHALQVVEGNLVPPLQNFLTGLMPSRDFINDLLNNETLTDHEWYHKQPHPKASYSTFYKNRRAGQFRRGALMLINNKEEHAYYIQHNDPQVSYTTFRKNRDNGQTLEQAILRSNILWQE